MDVIKDLNEMYGNMYESLVKGLPVTTKVNEALPSPQVLAQANTVVQKIKGWPNTRVGAVPVSKDTQVPSNIVYGTMKKLEKAGALREVSKGVFEISIHVMKNIEGFDRLGGVKTRGRLDYRNSPDMTEDPRSWNLGRSFR